MRRRIHRHPEPSGEEFETSELIRAHLAQHNIKARIAPRDVGVIAEMPIGTNSESGPVIALRADIDALRMPDRKSTEYASTIENCAHACGHDVHTTILLAACDIFSELRQFHQPSVPSARIRLIFQAAEEICKGAQWMVEDDAMDGVETIMGIHVDPQLSVGQVGICYGALTAQVDEILISVRGQGGHGARPHNTTDPIAAAAGLITMLHQQLPRSVDARDPSVFTVGQIHGGTAPNVIPDHVELNGTLRSITPEARAKLIAAIRNVCDHFAQMTGNTIAVEFRNPLGSVRNSKAPTDAFAAATRDALGEEAVVILDRPSMGGEDFAVYLDHAPGAQIRLGCAGAADWPLLHSPVFDVDERAIGIGARIVTRAVIHLLHQDLHTEFQI
jgi:amidohydrolase